MGVLGYQMVVIGHHRIGADIDGEDIGQLAQALGDPAFSVFVVLAGERVIATQEGSADTAGYRVAYRDVGA